MSNPRTHYDDATVPNRKINKTIIFTNSAKRKSHIKSAVANDRSNVASKQKEPQTLPAAPFPRYPLPPHRLATINTLMDSTNNSVSGNPTSSADPDINKAPSAFRFNFGTKFAESSRRNPNKPRKRRVPNKENGIIDTPPSRAQNAEESLTTSSDINTNAVSTLTVPPEDNLIVPIGTTETVVALAEASAINNQSNVFKKFENVDMTVIYPDRLEGILPPFGVQHRLGGVWYCLICDIKSMTFRTLKQHVASAKHGNLSEGGRSKLNAYIDFWAAQPDDCRKYQISFNISKEKDILKCSYCSVEIKDNKYTDHMRACKPVKSKKKYAKQKKYKPAGETGRVLPVGTKNRSGTVSDVGIEEVNEAATNVEERTLDPTKKKKEKKKSGPILLHDIRTHTVSAKWSKMIEGVSTRYNQHFRFFEKCTDDVIQCIACEMNIESDIMQLLAHLLTKDHYRKCGIYKIFWLYTCQMCDVDCASESDFWCHTNWDDNHKAKVQQLPESRHESLGEFECRCCKLIMLGDCDTVRKHLEAPVIKRKAANIIPIPTELDQAVMDLFRSRLHIESLAFELLNDANEVKNLEYQLTEIMSDLENTLRNTFPRVKAYPFGSRATGVCNKTSDLDLYVDIESHYYGDRTIQRTSVLQDVKRVLADKKLIWDDIFTIPGARTPIIQLRHIPTDIDIDLSFQNGLSVENTKFLKYCMDLQPKLRSMIVLLKLWSAVTIHKPHVTTYALCMLAIFKMQMDGHLIPVTYLRHLHATVKGDDPTPSNKRMVVTGWSIIDYRLTVEQLKEYVIPVTCDVFDLLKSFFAYYATFDYNKMICPLMGEEMNMDDWYEDNVSILPDEMSTYKNKVYDGLVQHTMYGYRFPITLQDPFDMSHNLMKSINKSSLNVWKANCQLSYDYLTKL